MEKTCTKPLYDVYQIHCKDAGFMMIDQDKKITEDYITILTLPFTKRIMNCYPDNQIINTEIKKSVTIDSLLNTDKQDTVEITVEEIDSKDISKENIEKVEGTIVTSENLKLDNDLEENKDKIKILINMLNDPTEQTVLLLRLGFVRNQYYSLEQISNFLNISIDEVNEIVNNALNNIHLIASLTVTSIENTKKQLGYTK